MRKAPPASLWRFDSADDDATQVATGGADLVNADGLIRPGGILEVVRNFSQILATLRDWILFVDSTFDEPVASGPYEVITDPASR